jgi:hypothetical protein
MKLQEHAHMLGIVTVAWFIFWLAGVPDYYQQYSTTAMVMFDLLILPPILFLIFRRVSKARPGQGLGVSLWWAFYTSVPLFIYDLIYCGYYLGHNVTFLTKYWYITVYYVLPWILFPPMGLLIDKKTNWPYRNP